MAYPKAAILLFSSTTFTGMPATEQERVYWDCEFLATQGRISLDQGAGCGELYEHLKKAKFGGDFARFLVWWRENKAREMSLRMAPRRPPDDE